MTADIVVTAAKVAAQPDTITRSYIAAVAIDAGEAVYCLAAGTVGLCESTTAAPVRTFFGIALESVGAGSAVTVAHEGIVDGFTVSGSNAGALLYTSATGGAVSDATTGADCKVGKVIARSDGSKTVFFKTNWLANIA
jgi:predicted RecA/RadA family phage recombinase